MRRTPSSARREDPAGQQFSHVKRFTQGKCLGSAHAFSFRPTLFASPIRPLLGIELRLNFRDSLKLHEKLCPDPFNRSFLTK